MGDIILKIIELEGPLHQEEIARRVASAFGKAKAGRRIVDFTFGALRALPRRKDSVISEQDEFWATSAQWAAPRIRDRSEENGATLAARMLPPQEIAAAAALIEKECGATSSDEMVKAVANLLGFRRVGPDLRQVIERVVHDTESVSAEASGKNEPTSLAG